MTARLESDCYVVQHNPVCGWPGDWIQIHPAWPKNCEDSFARDYFAPMAILSPFFTVTSATTFSPLSVRTSLPSVVCIMLRTTPPPAGITQVWNFSVLGSKRTSVLGRTPDSLYHTMPSTMVIP